MSEAAAVAVTEGTTGRVVVWFGRCFHAEVAKKKLVQEQIVKLDDRSMLWGRANARTGM